jgi:hypothetical protein
MTGSVSRAALAVLIAALAAACGGRAIGGLGVLGTEYEYEEDLTLSLDGSASLVVNTSVPALVVLRGASLPTDVTARGDQVVAQVRAFYTSDRTHVGRVTTWIRHGRRYVGVRLTVDNIRTLPTLAPFAWAGYDLHEEGDQVVFRETLSRRPAAASLAGTGLTGNEIVGFRLHLPARIRFQNSRYLDRDASRPAARGNIITWEQRLSDRLQGQPIAYAADRTPDVMEVRMDRQSILYRTLWLFGIAFAAAILVLAGLIWLTMRRGRSEAPADPPTMVSADPRSFSPRR